MEGLIGKKSLSFPIEPGPHRVHMTYENVAVPPEWTNLAILNYSIEVMVSDGTSSSSYQPDEGYPEPVSTEDEGEDVPCECGEEAAGGNGSQSSSSSPCPEEDNGEGDNGEDEDPCTCENNEGGSSSSARGALFLHPLRFVGRRQARGCPDAQDGNDLAYQFRLFPGHDGSASGIAGNSRIHILG